MIVKASRAEVPQGAILKKVANSKGQDVTPKGTRWDRRGQEGTGYFTVTVTADEVEALSLGSPE